MIYFSRRYPFSLDALSGSRQATFFTFSDPCMLNKVLLTFFSILNKKESIGIVKIFDFRFLTNLHVLGCFEGDDKMCVCRSVCDTHFVVVIEQKLGIDLHEILYLVAS